MGDVEDIAMLENFDLGVAIEELIPGRNLQLHDILLAGAHSIKHEAYANRVSTTTRKLFEPIQAEVDHSDPVALQEI